MMQRPFRLILVLAFAGLCSGIIALSVEAQTQAGSDVDADLPARTASSEVADANLHYVAGGSTMLYRGPSEQAPLQRMPVRTPLHHLGCEGDWCRVRLEDGEVGYVAVEDLSNVWIHVDKDQRRLHVYAGMEHLATYNADFGPNVFLDKERRGTLQEQDHWRTPEGFFHVVRRNANSQYYKALVLDYPGRDDAERGLEEGIISSDEYESIVTAHEERRMPPMSTELGGWIEIHGDGTGAATTWTRGCVALHNSDLDEIWEYADVGTPVLIR